MFRVYMGMTALLLVLVVISTIPENILNKDNILLQRSPTTKYTLTSFSSLLFFVQSVRACTAVKGFTQAQIKHKLQIAALIRILLATRQSWLDWNTIMATVWLFLYLNCRPSGDQELAWGLFWRLCTLQQLLQIFTVGLSGVSCSVSSEQN